MILSLVSVLCRDEQLPACHNTLGRELVTETPLLLIAGPP